MTAPAPASAPSRATERPDRPQRTLTTWKITILLVAMLTPLSIVVGTLPLGLGFGGPTTILMFVAAGIIIWLFAVGYVQMARRMSRPGAFYSYITRGLGRPSGTAAAIVALVGYSGGLVGAFAVQAFVSTDIFARLGLTVPWQAVFIAQVLIVAVLSYRQIDLSVRIVVVIVLAEVALLLALVLSIVAHKGAAAFPIAAVSPSVFGVGQWTVAFVFAILCFQGFEAGALYAPEAKRPEKSVPRGLYATLAVISLLMILVSWTLTSVSGVDTQQAVLQKAGFTGFIFTTVGQYLGSVGLTIFSIVAIIAQLACALAVTNFIARYLKSLASEDLIPQYLAKQNKHHAPGAAVLTLIALVVVVVLGLSLVGIDPYTQVAPVGFGIGALGATVLQALASASVVAFFLKRPASERHWWTTFLAPILATVLLVVALVIETTSFAFITGSQEAWTNYLPWAIPAALVFGVLYALWLRKNRPVTYADLGAGDSAEEAADLREIRVANRTAGADSDARPARN